MKYIYTFIIAFGLLISGISHLFYLYKADRIDQSIKVSGTVLEIQENRSTSRRSSNSYSPTISYTSLDGKQHQFTAEYSSAYDYEIGQQVELYYFPDQPEKPEITSTAHARSSAFSYVGLVIALVGLSNLIYEIYKEKRYQWFLLHGKRISTELKFIQKDPDHASKKQDNFYIIYTQWKDPITNRIHLFKSECMYYNPTGFAPQYIDVLVDPANYDKFHMEVSAIVDQQYATFNPSK